MQIFGYKNNVEGEATIFFIKKKQKNDENYEKGGWELLEQEKKKRGGEENTILVSVVKIPSPSPLHGIEQIYLICSPNKKKTKKNYLENRRRLYI